MKSYNSFIHITHTINLRTGFLCCFGLLKLIGIVGAISVSWLEDGISWFNSVKAYADYPSVSFELTFGISSWSQNSLLFFCVPFTGMKCFTWALLILTPIFTRYLFASHTSIITITSLSECQIGQATLSHCLNWSSSSSCQHFIFVSIQCFDLIEVILTSIKMNHIWCLLQYILVTQQVFHPLWNEA